MSLMPFIKLSALKYYALLTTSISLNGEIISPYSCYTKKGLVYIIIISPSSRQPAFYSKCTKAKTYLLYDVRLVPLNKYKFLHYVRRYTYYNLQLPYFNCLRVLGVIYC